MLILDIAWWKVLIGFFAMHYTAGLILSIVFQLAHVVEETEMPQPSDDGSMKNNLGNTPIVYHSKLLY